MATTFVEYTGDGNATKQFTFPSYQQTDIKVTVDGTTKTASTHYNITGYTTTGGGNVVFTSGNIPTSPALIRIFRDTDVDSAKATFTPGSSVKAADLNNNITQLLYAAQEEQNQLEQTADIRDDAVTTAKIRNDAVTMDKLNSGALPTDITVASANIVDGTIVNADVNASAAIAGTKISPDFGSQVIATTGNITVGGTVDGRDVAADGTKLDGIESGATADQTNAEIKTAYEANADTNAFQDAEKTKLSGIESGATADQTNAEIRAAVEAAADSNVFTDADHTKLNGIEAGATADQTNAEIRAAVEAASDSNVFTDADHSKLNAIEAGATADQTNAEIKTAYEANANTNEFSDAEQSKLAGIETAATADQTSGEIKTLLQSDKLTLSEINTTSTDSRYFTETELTGGALDGRYYTETEAEAKFLRQDSSETIASGATWSNSDAFVATTAAINARIIDLIDEVGGFTAITNETSFPATNPQGATGQSAILSIQAASTTLTPSGTTVTIANGAGTGNTVTITGVSAAIPTGFGFLVESTSTLHTYSFHRLVPVATQVNTVASNITNIVNAGANVVDINNFADIYIISASQPSTRNDGSALQEGDLWFDSSNDNLQVYTGSAFSIITPSQSVLDDVAIVSGAITYQEDLGLITAATTTGSSNGSLDIVADLIEDEITFTVTAATGKFIIDGVDKPALTLHKGWTYTFDVSDASNANHPLRFSSGGSAYNTGVTVTGTQGQAGAKVQLVVPESQPTTFIYYCTNHSGMGNSITVVEDPIKLVADNITSVNTTATSITNVNTTAGSISNVNTVGASINDVNRYATEYQISASAPGSPSAGDLWFDTTTNTLKNYNGSAWLGITSNSGIQNVADDTSPQLAATLDGQNNNLTNIGTIDGANLQLDFGTL
tara:strand:+ start:2663 stop:5371 length:2709 start_codon:yes stop_codon:yes gene_type:complete